MKGGEMADAYEKRLSDLEREFKDEIRTINTRLNKIDLVLAVTAEQFQVIKDRLEKIEENQVAQARKQDERNVWLQRLLVGVIASYFLNWILPLITRGLNGP